MMPIVGCLWNEIPHLQYLVRKVVFYAKFDKNIMKSISIIGTVGVPASYGGFETLVENLVKYHQINLLSDRLVVYCSGKSYSIKEPQFLSARLKYVPIKANGVQSIAYDIVSLLSAILHRNDVVLVLGVSGAIALPLVRLFFSVRIITNIDGIEWRREKWKGLVRRFLRFSEKVAVRYSHDVIADNAAIAAYVKAAYGKDCHVIAYGGDHAVRVEGHQLEEYCLPEHYAFAVCRIEPENNVHMVLEAFALQSMFSLVLVGNWNNGEYGRQLRERYSAVTHLYLLDPIYDLHKLKTLRSQAALYVHGHSAGGTNPSLVEAMHFGCPVIAFDCDFNRATTENMALYFNNSASLYHQIDRFNSENFDCIGNAMLEIARRCYTWDVVGCEYFKLMSKR